MTLLQQYNSRVTAIFKITLNGGESLATVVSRIKAQRDRARLVGIHLAIEDLLK